MSLMTFEQQQVASKLLHPMSGEAWFKAYHASISDADKSALASRFSTSGIEPSLVIGAVDHATMLTGAIRVTKEKENIARMGLSDDAINEYEQQHDRRIDTAQFLQRFGIWAQIAKAKEYHHDPRELFDEYKYGLELYGTFQHGNWDATRNIDAAIRTLPAQLDTEFPFSHSRHVYTDKEKAKLGYTYTPINIIEDIDANSRKDEVAFGLVRRRRAVADIIFDNLDVEVDVFKESTALVIVDLLPQTEKEVLLKDARITALAAKKGANIADDEGWIVTTANRFAGKRFELGIAEGKGLTRDIVPISSHYVAMVAISAALK